MSIAVVAAGYGGPENLSVVESAVGGAADALGPGEVLLDVRAAGVNPFDAKIYSGTMGVDPARLPIPLGAEAAGVVVAVGPGAVGPMGEVNPGDEVIAYPTSGAYASHLVVRSAALVPKPAVLSWEQAAGLMLAGTTAAHALAVAHPDAGETVLIHGAAGGVGLAAVQLAVARGVRVIATAAPANHDLLREWGAVPVAYGEGLLDRVRSAASGGVDAAVDTVGTDEAVDVSVELVPDRSRVVTIASFGYGAERGIVRIGGGPGADPGTKIRDEARLELVRMVGEGTLRVLVAATFPLKDAAEAHRTVMGRHAPGKIILVP